jgi:hypothetical protein
MSDSCRPAIRYSMIYIVDVELLCDARGSHHFLLSCLVDAHLALLYTVYTGGDPATIKM